MLTRQITTDILSERKESPAVGILQKYFNVNTELGKELQLYHAFLNVGQLTESRAVKFIDMVLDQRKKLNERKLAQEKYELIKELKSVYNLQEFMSCKLPAYKLYASIFKTFIVETRHNNDTIVNIHDVASARFTLIEHLIKTPQKKTSTSESALLESFKNEDEDIRLLAYKLMVDKFNNRYADLNDKQKQLLREYINNVSSSNTLTNYVRQEVPTLQRLLAKQINEVNDVVTKIKLKEVALQLDKIGQKKVIKDNEITAMMIGYEIVKELTNV